MEDYKYIIEISMENKCLKGKLQEIKKVNKITTIDKNIKIDKDTNVGEIVNTDKKNIVVKDHEKLINYDFVPTSVLCDLSVLEYETNTIDKDIIYIGYKYEKAFETPIKIDKHQDIYYYSFAELIKERIVNNEPISFKELDKLKLFFNINLNYSISYKEKSNKIKNDFDYIPLQYGFCNIEKVFENNDKKPHKYIYNCNTLTDVIFAILHYLVMNKYTKIRKCNHCGKLYYYNHEKQIYCKRKSPYENYTHLECEQAVRNIKKKLSDRNKSIKSNLDNYYEHNFEAYIEQWYKYKDEVDKCSSIENLKILEVFTEPSNMKKNFYINTN